MILSRLIYASRATDALREPDIEQILKVSVERNSKAGVTGLLLHSSREFLQCLEGGREAVNTTYARILRDSRHSDVLILDFREIPYRLFPEWGMRQLPPMAITRRRLLRYFPREMFTPGRMTADNANALLTDLATSEDSDRLASTSVSVPQRR